MAWTTEPTAEFDAWFDELSSEDKEHIVALRILYAFDGRRRGILLLGGDKAGDWDAWYDRNAPIADALFTTHTAQAGRAEASMGASSSTTPTTKKKRGRRGR